MTKNNLPVWAIKFKRFRLSKGLTQSGLANILGLSVPAIRSYEQGIRKPKKATMDLMKKEIGLNIYEIFFNDELEEIKCTK